VKPVVLDFFCGLGGWSKGFMQEGWDAIGFDIERHKYGDKRYPGELILADVLTLKRVRPGGGESLSNCGFPSLPRVLLHGDAVLSG